LFEVIKDCYGEDSVRESLCKNNNDDSYNEDEYETHGEDQNQVDPEGDDLDQGHKPDQKGKLEER
jgi:hypothetical protein